jgi:beta-glucanase (GH16 family)
MPVTVYGQWPLSGEIDIMENIGREADTVHGTIHYGDAWPGNLNTGERVQLPNRDEYASAFHNYAVFWEEDRLRWLLDGTQYSQKTPDDIAPYNWPFNEKFHFVINLAIGGNWPGNPDNSTSFPQQMKIDFVRIYDKPFGRLTGPAVVNENEQDIVFELEGGLSDFTYSWSVPSDASITTSNPSSSASISVDFGTESGYVAVEATSSKCGATKTFSMPVLVGGEFLYTPGATVVDCGCPDTCTSSILDSLATDTSGAYSCRERINWVMANRYLVEKAACEAVYDEFPSECTCDPSSCS